jgi:protein-tyrosine phosphatase
VLDLHAHVLPGLDDGVRSLDEALELVRAAAAEGVTAIAATPHVRDDYPTSAAQMEAGVAVLRAAVEGAGLPVEILHGGEVDVDRLWQLSPDELRRFTIAQTGRYLLIETPYRGWPRVIERACSLLRGRGITPLLAHPERNAHVQDSPALLEPLVADGVLVQVTSASLDGRLGSASRLAAQTLIERRLVHVIASDAHGPQTRMAGMAGAAAAVGDEELARRLTTETPAAIAAGEPV